MRLAFPLLMPLYVVGDTQARGAPDGLQALPQQSLPGHGIGHYGRPARLGPASEGEGLDGRIQNWLPATGEIFLDAARYAISIARVRGFRRWFVYFAMITVWLNFHSLGARWMLSSFPVMSSRFSVFRNLTFELSGESKQTLRRSRELDPCSIPYISL